MHVLKCRINCTRTRTVGYSCSTVTEIVRTAAVHDWCSRCLALVTAAVSHLAASTKPDQVITVSFMNDWTNEHIAGYQPRSKNGIGCAPNRPGLGVDVEIEHLGKPFIVS